MADFTQGTGSSNPAPKVKPGPNAIQTIVNKATSAGKSAPAKPAAKEALRAGWQNMPYASMNATERNAWNAMQAQNAQNASNASGSSGSNSAALAAQSAAAALAEQKREFGITASRDKAKQDALEVTDFQKQLAAMTGAKDQYGYDFWSRGLTPPQGYKPAGAPVTAAQQASWLAANPGKKPADLQNFLTGGGKAPIWAQGGQTALGGMPQSMQASTITGAQAPSPSPLPTAPPPPITPPWHRFGPPTPSPAPNQAGAGPVPSMAAGGQVPGPPGTPSLAVVHGGEHVTPAPGGPPPALAGGEAPQMPEGQQGPPQQGQDLNNAPGLHPAIAALVDAVSGLLQNPDFAPFVKGALQSTQATPGGAPSMARGGTVPLGAPTQAPAQSPYQSPQNIGAPTQAPINQRPSPLATPPVGTPTPGAQGVTYNTTAPVDQPIEPLAKMDPYSQALYDSMGKLHPYSAQQEAQMGPSGQAAVASYVGKVEGVNVADYLDMVNRLKPQNGAPPASGGAAGGGFTFG